MLDEFGPDIVMLQETMMHHLEEAETANKLGLDRPFILNSPGLHIDDFGARMEVTKDSAHHRMGIIINIRSVAM